MKYDVKCQTKTEVPSQLLHFICMINDENQGKMLSFFVNLPNSCLHTEHFNARTHLEQTNFIGIGWRRIPGDFVSQKMDSYHIDHTFRLDCFRNFMDSSQLVCFNSDFRTAK